MVNSANLAFLKSPRRRVSRAFSFLYFLFFVLGKIVKMSVTGKMFSLTYLMGKALGHYGQPVTVPRQGVLTCLREQNLAQASKQASMWAFISL